MAQETRQETAGTGSRVILYEKDSDNSPGNRSTGTAVWRVQADAPRSGTPPEHKIHADIQIPERKIGMSWTLSQNRDTALPASHIIEISFRLPTNFAHGSVASLPGMLVKAEEQARGVQFFGRSFKVAPDTFRIGLSSVESDKARNIANLKDGMWFDIPLIYSNNLGAVMALEKGQSGQRVFAEAFAAWQQ
jgi:hypothetical protein